MHIVQDRFWPWDALQVVWRRKANLRRRRKRWRNFVVCIGGPFIASSGDKELGQRTQRT